MNTERRLTASLALLLAACGPCEPPGDVDGGADASAFDVGGDVTFLDGFVPDVGDASDVGADDADASVDGAFDGGVDTGPGCDCPASTVCLSHACVDGVCVATPESSCTSCGEMPMGVPEGVCLEGACVMRRCGDGYRELGSFAGEPAPAREGCDDGNLEDGDACSASCEPMLYEVIPSGVSGGETVIPQLRGQRPALAVDDAGRVLAVWLESQYPSSSEEQVILARRFTPEGVPVGDIIEVVRGPGTGLPVPVGLADGWAILHSSSTVALDGFVFRRVQVDGTLGMPRLVPSTGSPRSPFATRHGDGVLAVWVRGVSGRNRVYARRLNAFGSPLDTDDVEVTPPDVMRSAINPRVASIRAASGSNVTALIAWTDTGGDYPTLYGRRLRDASGDISFVDSAPFEIPTDPIPFAGGAYVAALTGEIFAGAVSSDARFVVAWSGGEVMRSDTSTTFVVGRIMAREVTGSSSALPAQQVLASDQGGDNFPVVVAEPAEADSCLGPGGETHFVVAWHASTGAVITGDHLPPEVTTLRAAWTSREETLGLVATPNAGYGPGIWVTSVNDFRSSPGLNAFLLPYSGSR